MSSKELKDIDINSVIPYDNNPRLNEKAVEDVIKSIEDVGYRTPIIVDENMIILVGHTRLKALKKMGWQKIPLVIQYTDLNEKQKKRYRVLDNKASEKSEWDTLKLGIDFTADELKELGFDYFKDKKKEEVGYNGNLPIEIDINREQNYIMVLCEGETDFIYLQQKLKMREVINPKNRKVGLARVITFKELSEHLK